MNGDDVPYKPTERYARLCWVSDWPRPLEELLSTERSAHRPCTRSRTDALSARPFSQRAQASAAVLAYCREAKLNDLLPFYVVEARYYYYGTLPFLLLHV
jgi:hypothetical protein